jgi:hypothetical protein
MTEVIFTILPNNTLLYSTLLHYTIPDRTIL